MPITGTEAYRPLVFEFPIAMGVRKGDQPLAARLDEVIERRREDIRVLLMRSGVPLLDLGGGELAKAQGLKGEHQP